MTELCCPLVGARYLTGENLQVVWAEFSTLSWPVYVMSVNEYHTQTHPNLKLKTRPRCRPESLYVHVVINICNDLGATTLSLTTFSIMGLVTTQHK
jgi:hypothetical protein